MMKHHADEQDEGSIDIQYERCKNLLVAVYQQAVDDLTDDGMLDRTVSIKNRDVPTHAQLAYYWLFLAGDERWTSRFRMSDIADALDMEVGPLRREAERQHPARVRKFHAKVQQATAYPKQP